MWHSNQLLHISSINMQLLSSYTNSWHTCNFYLVTQIVDKSFFQLMSTCTFRRDTCNSTRVARISKKYGGWVARFVEIHATQPGFACFLKYVQVLPTLTLTCFYLRVTPFIKIHATQLGLHISRKNTGLSCTFHQDTCNSTRVARISKKHRGWVARFVEIHATQPEFVCFLKYVQVVPTLTNDMFLSLGYTFHRDTCNSTRGCIFLEEIRGWGAPFSSRYVQLNPGCKFLKQICN
jgi:hypothetical protein